MIELCTDYRDCYDTWLELPGRGDGVFARYAQNSHSTHRSDMFQLFETLKIPAPKFQHAVLFNPGTKIVLYTNPLSHCGEGKELVEADFNLPINLYASEYVPDFPGLSYRYFVIAGKGYWFEHWSTKDWRSNCGDGDFCRLSDSRGEIYNLNQIERGCSYLKNPVYALDFVARKCPFGIELLAVDWNPAPRLAGSPVEGLFQEYFRGNQGIAKAISDHFQRLNVDYLDNNRILL